MDQDNDLENIVNVVNEEGKNFYRIAVFVAEHVRKGLCSLIDLHTKRLHCSLEEFLKIHCHDIYHLCYNEARCCQCSDKHDYKLPSRKLLSKRHFETLLEKSGKVPSDCESNSTEHSCIYSPRPNIDVSNLNVLIVKVLLVSFCRDIFWYSCLELYSMSFQEFLDKNKHIIYHLWKYDTMCCQCSQNSIFPSDNKCLNEDQWDMLYNTKSDPCAQHTNRQKFANIICAVKAQEDIKVKDLDLQLQDTILLKCCRLRKTITTLDTTMAKIYDAGKSGQIWTKDYQHYKEELAACLRDLAKVSGKTIQVEKDISDTLNQIPSKVKIRAYQSAILDMMWTEESLNTKPSPKQMSVARVEDNRSQEHSKETMKDKQVSELEICEICKEEEKLLPAEGWCSNCEQLLCQSCIKSHRVIKATKAHKIINVVSYQQLPNIKQSCENHNKKYEMFCETHGMAFCITCESHNSCTVHSLDSYATGIKGSAKFNNVKSMNQTLFSNISTKCDIIDTELKLIPEKTENFRRDVKNSKQKLEDVICSLEQQGLNIITKYEQKMKAIYEHLLVCKETVNKSKDELSTLEQYGSDSLAFLGVFEIERMLQRSENSFIEIFEENNVATIKPAMNISVESIGKHIFSLGLAPISCPSEVLSVSLGISQTSVQSMNLDKRNEIQIQKPVTSDTCEIQIRGCTLLANGEMWFTDKDNCRVVFYSSNGKFIGEKKLSSTPIDIVRLAETKIAISLENKTLLLIEVDSKHSNEFFIDDSPGKFGGLTNYKEKLLVRIGGFGYYMFNSKGEIVRKIKMSGSYMPYITCTRNRLYYSKWDVKKVFCCDMSGKPLWEFDCGNILQPPNGITADENGNVFVTGSYSNNIMVISADGKDSKVLIEGDLLNNPIPITYDHKTKRLLVACMAGSVYLFSVKR